MVKPSNIVEEWVAKHGRCYGSKARNTDGARSTVAPLMLGKPLLNNALNFADAQLQIVPNCLGVLGDLTIFWVSWVICQHLPFAKL